MKKTKYPKFPKGNYTLLDTATAPEYDIYLTWCEDTDTEPQAETSTAFYSWQSEEKEMEIEDFLYNVEFAEDKHAEQFPHKYAICGDCGTWRGSREIVPEFFDTLKEAIQKILFASFDNYTEFHYNNGIIEAVQSHHDGTNVFYIRGISARGLHKETPTKETDFRRIPYIYNL